MTATTDLEIGDTLDLGCRFGDQIRLKCPVCTRYLKRSLEPTTCARCGTAFLPLTDTIFQIAGLPDD